MRFCAPKYPASACLIALSLSCFAAEPAGTDTGLTVDSAVAEALANNVSLLAERSNIGVAEARIISVRLRPNPVLSGGGDHLDVLGTQFSEANGGGPGEFNIRGDYLIERGGKRKSRVAVAESARSVAELVYADAARNLAMEVQSAFVDALAARDDLALARQNLGSFDRIVTINEARLRAGDLSKVELVRSRLAALQYRNSVRQADLRLRTALTQLGKLLGRPNPASVTAVTGKLRCDPEPSPIAEIRERALRFRPDLMALRRDVARSEAELRLQNAGAKADYTVGTEYRRQQGVNGKSNSVGLFVEVPLPFFNRNQGEIERARVEKHQAELRVRDLENSIAAEIATATHQCLTARDLLHQIQNSMLQEAREVREVTEYSYRRGEASLLEMLDAQRAFNETLQSYNEARAEYARSLYLLDSVSGKEVNP